ncbi:hypothetical protein GCM10018793_44950 [Streptomyces sulfonofaciens]|uniref:ABC transporter domain-containing protein n=1 Tax=Streptomyces sulfonofaciens TaxID=68272 RepID=A0A919GEQ4_9ACTN|nr:alpha/beta fold hydrolase [Streptomyces sulfonofaciens]GHH83273.1 hypothetical protein GCM10018793_44950 [Streptomyces sulfonofaciens]
MVLRLPGRRASRLPGSRRVRRWAAAVAAVAVLATGGIWSAAAAGALGGQSAVHRTDRMLPTHGATIDTSYFTAGDPGARRPAVLLAHGFGGSKDDVRPEAEQLARDGYAVLTWSARGFGHSTGKIGLNDPKAEVADVSRLIDWLSHRPEVQLDHPGDPRVGVTGSSYGGAVSLLAAGYDHRVDAIAPQITYWNLADALFPDGVFKKLWAGIFFTTGAAGSPADQQDQQDRTPPGPGGAGPGGAGGGDSPVSSDAPGSADPAGAARSDGGGGLTAAGASVGSATAVVLGASGGSGPADRGAAGPPDASACGRFETQLCAMYQRVAENGRPDAAARALLEARSPSAVGDRIKVPTLIAQGQADSLFPLGQADAMAERIKANGAPVDVDWLAGGHDGGDLETGRMTDRVAHWFDRYLGHDTSADTGPVFRISRTGGVDTTDGTSGTRGATGDRYPGLNGHPRTVPLRGTAETFVNPPGGGPPSISAVPGLSGASQLSGLGLGPSLDFPGQYARFDSAPLERDLRITGSPTVTVHVRSSGPDAVLFGKLYDVSPGQGGRASLPEQLVSPLRIEGAQHGKEVRVTLPALDHEVVKGHRLRLVLASTDLAYASPAAPATYTVSLAGDGLHVPTAPGVSTSGAPVPSWVWWLPAAGAAVALGLVLTGRRRAATPAPDPRLADVPLQITGLSKRYANAADRYAVRDLAFRVERGQVLGLLGPNGAGKTTTLRMLMGLITPDAGEIRVFGHAIRPGAPVLSRVGAFVEGAGFLPHLSGRANLDLYWQATGRPAQDAHAEQALHIAGLGDALDRAVRTYSQGMRQRLALAQAMLGLPDLLILDEPTNGLDPPQIREMRDVMIRYARGGRTVIVSSHLLAEVEQSCTHLVVMDRGRLVQAGPVADIVGSGDTLLVGLARELPAPLLDRVGALPEVASAVPVPDGLLIRLAVPAGTEGQDGGDGAAAEPAAARLLAGLVGLGVPVTSMGPHRRLEDAFLTLIGGAA